MIKSKLIERDFIQETAAAEALDLFERVSQIDLGADPEERPRDSLSAPLIPTCNRQLSLPELREIINTLIPKKWRKQITEIVW